MYDKISLLFLRSFQERRTLNSSEFLVNSNDVDNPESDKAKEAKQSTDKTESAEIIKEHDSAKSSPRADSCLDAEDLKLPIEDLEESVEKPVSKPLSKLLPNKEVISPRTDSGICSTLGQSALSDAMNEIAEVAVIPEEHLDTMAEITDIDSGEDISTADDSFLNAKECTEKLGDKGCSGENESKLEEVKSDKQTNEAVNQNLKLDLKQSYSDSGTTLSSDEMNQTVIGTEDAKFYQSNVGLLEVISGPSSDTSMVNLGTQTDEDTKEVG